MALKLLNTCLCVLAITISATQSVADPSCESYATLKRLPDRFFEIASALLDGDVELFIVTDGACTCTNEPAVDRELGKPVPPNVIWSCRKATADEKKY
jgi:hypothetical protein